MVDREETNTSASCSACVALCLKFVHRSYIEEYTSIQLSGTSTGTEEYTGVMRSLYTGGNVDGDGAWG